MSDPASWKRAQEQARLLSDPASWKRAQEQARLLSDPATWRRVQEEAQLLSDPARWQRARENLRLLTDPSALSDAEARLASMRAALGRLQDEVRPVTEASILDEVRAASRPGANAAKDLETEVAHWYAELAEVASLDPAFLEPRDVGDGEFGWVASLPTLVQMKLLTQSLSVLNMILLAAATMGVAAVPLAFLLAAEVLIRLIDALLTYLGGERK